MNRTTGYLGILGIWVTMSMMPISKQLPFTSEQLLVMRGASGLLFSVITMMLWKEFPKRPDRNIVMTSLAFCTATFAIFQAFKAWGTNGTMVLLDMAVLVPFAVSYAKTKKVEMVEFYTFGVAIIGSFLAVRGWNTEISTSGLLWSLLALVANGAFIQTAGKKEGVIKRSDNEMVFYLSLPLVLFGLMFWGSSPDIVQKNPLSTWLLIVLVVIFSMSTGYANFVFGFMALSNLKPTTVGVLVLGVTPSVIIGSYFITGEVFGLDQLLGVVIIIASLAFVGLKK